MKSVSHVMGGETRSRTRACRRFLALFGAAIALAGAGPALAQSTAGGAQDALPRFRFGADVGPLLGYGDNHGWWGAAAHLRLGVQVAEVLAFDYQAAGILVNEPTLVCLMNCSSPTNLVHTSSLMIDFTLADRIQLGAGPSLGVNERAALAPGFSGRFAALWGKLTPSPRYGFAFGVQFDVVPDFVSTFTTTLGFEYY